VLLDRGFTSYFGVDISAHSIRTAREWNRETPGAKFTQGTIEPFEHPQGEATRWDVVVLSEVLYYLDLRHVRQLLVERASLLSADGVFCISLNLHPQGRAFQREISPVLEYLGGFIHQVKTQMDDQVRENCERAIFHTFAARPVLNAKNQT
jgi:SAM-dependent methyltransferase